ncbi:hypothetical protein CHUAL_006691 [Chamberlinius hualienensis]
MCCKIIGLTVISIVIFGFVSSSPFKNSDGVISRVVRDTANLYGPYLIGPVNTPCNTFKGCQSIDPLTACNNYIKQQNPCSFPGQYLAYPQDKRIFIQCGIQNQVFCKECGPGTVWNNPLKTCTF